MTHSSLDFLSQYPNAIIRDTKMQTQILNLITYFTKCLINTLEQFYILKNYHNFDPHVGETSCQIRAYNFLFLIKESKNDYHINERIKELNDIYGKLNSELKYNNFILNKYSTIEDFIKSTNFYFPISTEENFLTKSFFLSRFKRTLPDNDTIIDYDKISNNLDISRKLSKKLVRFFQIQISDYSCSFIYSLLDLKKLENEKIYLLKKHDDDNRSVLPCYFSTKIILKHLIKNSSPILMIIHRKSNSAKQISKFFCDSKSNYKNILPISQLNPMDLKNPCFVIEGETIYQSNELESNSDFLTRINSVGLWKILMSNMAIHCQYSGNNLYEYSVNPFKDFLIIDETLQHMKQDFISMRETAHFLGCCQDNRSLFFVKHIYFNTFSDLIFTDKQTDILDFDIVNQMNHNFSATVKQTAF